MKLKHFIFGLSLVIAGFLGGNAQKVHAESLNFDVGAVLPDNQANKDVTYFDLLVKPNAEQNLQVRINNKDSQEHEYKVAVNRAVTNRNGVIDYSDHGKKADKSLVNDIEKYTTKPQTVKVPAKTSQVVTINLKTPAKGFDGVMLGGVRVMQVDQAKTSSKKGVTLTNRFAYVIGLQLHENDKKIKPDLRLLKVTPKQLNYRNYITVTLQNNQPTIMRDFNVNAVVTKRGSTKKVISYKKNGMSMAPNSNFALPLGDQGYQLEPGKYTLTLKANADSKKYNWKFSKDFEITANQAKKLNSTSVDQPEKKNNYMIWLLIIGIIVILLLIILIIILLKRKKDDDDDEQKDTTKSTDQK